MIYYKILNGGQMGESITGKCCSCDSPILKLYWLHGRVVISVLCSCGTGTAWYLDNSLASLGEKPEAEFPDHTITVEESPLAH
jgi:hypothetical protein